MTIKKTVKVSATMKKMVKDTSRRRRDKWAVWEAYLAIVSGAAGLPGAPDPETPEGQKWLDGLHRRAIVVARYSP